MRELPAEVRVKERRQQASAGRSQIPRSQPPEPWAIGGTSHGETCGGVGWRRGAVDRIERLVNLKWPMCYTGLRSWPACISGRGLDRKKEQYQRTRPPQHLCCSNVDPHGPDLLDRRL